jgi:ABC-type transport system involved in multi-copper enzyme maturation permease subunit
MTNGTITINLTWRGVIIIFILVFIVIPLIIIALNNPALTIILLPFAFFLFILATVIITVGLIVLIIKIAQKLKLVE